MADPVPIENPFKQGTTAQPAPVPIENPFVYQPSTGQGEPDQPSMMTNPKGQSFGEWGRDFVGVAANAMTFNQADKLAALKNVIEGKGTYEEMLRKNRELTAKGAENIGVGGELAANVLGGGLTGSGLARAGLTIAGRVPQAASALTKIGAGIVEGGLYGAAQSVGKVDSGKAEDYLRAAKEGAIPGAIGGAAVSAAGSVLPRMITPVPSVRGAEGERLTQVLRNAGVRVSAAQRTGSPTLATAEDAAQALPFSRLFANKPTRIEQSTQVARAAADNAGVAPGQLTSASINDAFDTVGGRIGTVQGLFPVQLDAAYRGVVNGVQGRLGLLSAGDGGIIRDYLRRMDPALGTLSPAAAQAIRTDLRLSMQTGQGASAHFNRTLQTLRDALDDGLTRTITRSAPPHLAPHLINELAQARQQYANLHVLTDALARSGSAGASGRVTPTALEGALKSDLGKVSYMRGRGNLNNLAKASSSILPIREGSQTAERSAYYNPIKLAMTAPLNVTINSRLMQGYLGNQVMPGTLPQGLIPPAIGGIAAEENSRAGLLSPSGQRQRRVPGLLQ